MVVGRNGFNAFNGNLMEDSMEDYFKLKLNNELLRERLEFLCEFFRNYLEEKNLKKRKPDRSASSIRKTKKKAIERDENGNIIYPIQVSASMKLLAAGN